MSIRKVIFWLHLIAGAVAGGSILIMCVTRTAIAAVASAFGAVLVWTGFALVWRRFTGRKKSNRSAHANATASTPEPATLPQ